MSCKTIPFISSQWGTQINPCKCCMFALNPVAAFLHALKRPLKMSILVTFAFSEKGYDLFIPCGAFDPGSCFSYIFVKLQFSQKHCHFNEITRTCLKWYWIPIRQWELSREVEHSIMMHLRKNDMKRIVKIFLKYSSAQWIIMQPFNSWHHSLPNEPELHLELQNLHSLLCGMNRYSCIKYNCFGGDSWTACH